MVEWGFMGIYHLIKMNALPSGKGLHQELDRSTIFTVKSHEHFFDWAIFHFAYWNSH